MPQLLRLSILDTYGVRWSRETFARDLVQNFFDSAPDFREVHVDVNRAAGTVTLQGPVVFDIDYLAYVGATTKRDGRTAGGFGEGFKICALVGTRDFGLGIRAASGNWELEVVYERVPLGRELCYRVGSVDPPYAGSSVTLTGVDEALLTVFDRARDLFRHADNPLLTRCITRDPRAPAAVFLSAHQRDGHLFYRRQLRGTVRYWAARNETGLTFVHDAPIDALEGDRDRHDLPAAPLVYAVASVLSTEELHTCALAMEFAWSHGHDVMTELLRAMIDRKLTFAWPAGWLARESDDGGLGDMAERQGHKLARAGFGAVGMRKVSEQYSGTFVTRAPTPLERARIQVAVDLHGELTGSAPNEKPFEVFPLEGAAVRGQHLTDRILVAQELIADGFDACAPTILHELAHRHGGEESKGFLGALTEILGAVLRQPERVTAARERFALVTGDEAAARAPPELPPEPERYQPEARDPELFDDESGVFCVLYVPPAFPPTLMLKEALRTAAQRAFVPLQLHVRAVASDKEAAAHLLTGVPTLRIGLGDVETAQPPFGLRINPAGLALDVDACAAQLLRARDEGYVGSKGAHPAWGALQARRTALGLDPPRAAQMLRAERRQALLKRVDRWLTCGDGLFGVWASGLRAGAKQLVNARLDDPRADDELVAEVHGLMERAIALSRGLRSADGVFDDGEPFECDAMAAAQGVAVVTAVFEPEFTVPRFEMVRRLTAEILDLPVHWDLKSAALEHAVRAYGLEAYSEPTPLDADALEREGARAIQAALELQRRHEDQGGLTFGFAYSMSRALAPSLTHEETPAGLEAIARTHHAREVYQQAMADGAGMVEAARRALEVVREKPEEDA